MRIPRTRTVLLAALVSLFAATSHAQTSVCSNGSTQACPYQTLSETTGLPEVSAGPPWTLLSRHDDADTGYVLQRRKRDGSNFSTFRLEAILDSPADLVALVAARNLADPDYHQENTDKRILRDDAEGIVIYSYIHVDAPFVSDRDIVSRVERFYNPKTGTYRLSWKAVDEGPPNKDGVVRLARSEGSWTFSPKAEGDTRAVYVSYTETAGYVPAWIINSRMNRTMVQEIEDLRKAVRHERQRE